MPPTPPPSRDAQRSAPSAAEDAQRIDHALRESKARTAVHIAPVIVRASGRYDRPEDMAGLVLGLLVALGVWLVLPDAQRGDDSWAGYSTTAKVTLMALALIAGFMLGSFIAGRWWSLRRLFTPRLQMRDSVERAAAAAFHAHLTAPAAARRDDAPGLLIYLSLYERRATLLADAIIEQAIGQAQLDTLCRDLTILMRQDNPGQAVSQTIRRAAAACADAFPPVSPAE